LSNSKNEDLQSILITGSSGFLGCNLADHLSHSKQFKLILINRENHYDLSNGGWTDKIPDTRVDTVIHLAQSNKYREFPEGAEDMFRVNIAATFELLEWSRKNGVKRFIFASTGNVYKNFQGKATENSECDPESFYAVSKYCAENLIETNSDIFEVIIVRIFGLYGPGQKDNLVSNIIKKIQSGKELTLASGKGLFITPVFIEDAVNSFIKLISSPLSNPKLIVNLAGDNILSLYDIAFTISKAIDKSPNIKVTKEIPKYLCGDNLKYKNIFGIKKFILFDESIKKTLIEEGLK
jgi:nucleoside-diphosphate-sugar epimerase